MYIYTYEHKHVEQLTGTFSEEIQSNHGKVPLYKEAFAVIGFPNCPWSRSSDEAKRSKKNAPLPASKGKVLQLPGTFSEEVQ